MHNVTKRWLGLMATASLILAGCSSSAATQAPTTAATAAATSAATNAATAAPATPKLSSSVVMTNSGGAFNDCIAAQWFAPFTTETGITVVKGPETDASKIKAMVETGQYDVDVNFVPDPALIQEGNAQNLFEKIDYTQVPKDQIISGLTPPYGVAVDTYSYIMGYRTDKFSGTVPQTWADFFDTTKFPGKRAMSDQVITNVYYMALMADGVAPADLTTIDIARALKKLDTIKSDIVWYQTGQQAQDLLGSGEVVMAELFANRVANLVNDGKPVAPVWNGQIIATDFLAIPKGDPNAATAQKLIAYITRADVNGKLSSCQAIGPANTKSTTSASVSAFLPSSHLDVPYVVSTSTDLVNYSAAHIDEMTTKFQDWKTQ